MPERGEGQKDLCDDVVRGTMKELHSADWWRALRIDAVAIVTWGHAEDTPVICAAKASGIKVILVTDDGNGGRIPVINLLKITWERLYHLPFARRVIEALVKFPILYIWFTWRKRGRFTQYRNADMITCWTSRIAKDIRKGMRCEESVGPKFLLGYPSSTDSTMIFKDKTPSAPPAIIAVARWDAIKHKRPHFLMDVCKILLERDPNITIHIYGKLIPYMHQVYQDLPASHKERLNLHGFADNSEVLSRMRQCEVAICPSAADCGPVPMAEALCQGCSVVGGGNVAAWAAELGYGTSVPIDTPLSFSESVMAEIEKWKRGTYSRRDSALYWRGYYSSIRFAEEISAYVRNSMNSG